MRSKYINPTTNIIRINLKSERRPVVSPPSFIINKDYSQIVRSESVLSAPPDHSPKHSIPRPANTPQRVSLSRHFTSDSISTSRSRSVRSNSLSSRSNILASDSDVDFHIAQLLDVNLDSDNDAPDFLATLPDRYEDENCSNSEEPSDEDLMDEAFNTALVKQTSTQDFFDLQEENRPVIPRPPNTPKPTKKIMTAEQIKEQWGFQDDSVGRAMQSAFKHMSGSKKKTRK